VVDGYEVFASTCGECGESCLIRCPVYTVAAHAIRDLSDSSPQPEVDRAEVTGCEHFLAPFKEAFGG